MKTMSRYALVLISGMVLLGLWGCKPEGGLDTAKVQSAFQTAEADDKAEVDKAISSIKSGDYTGALASLQKASANLKLTEEQKSALADLINQVKAKVGETAQKVAEDTSQAVKEGAEKASNELKKAVSP